MVIYKKRRGTLIMVVAALLLVFSVPGLTAGGNRESPDGSEGSESSESGERKGPITVASKIDTEGSLLGYMMVLLLEDAGFEVKNQVEFGPTDVIRRAITSGEIDIYPEYTGNGAFFFDEAESDVWKDPQAGYDRVRELDRERNNLIWLAPA
ncbi:MAG: glycine betaine ABC transporter substrate-binding protein, partial [Alkalispirochaeta sp.]